jgi:hypothetical protein
VGKAFVARVRWRGDLTIHADQADELVIDTDPPDGTNPTLLAWAERYRLIHLFTVPDSDEVHWVQEGSET